MTNLQLTRAKENPIITKSMISPSHPNLQVIGVFNAAVTEYQDETLLLLRIAETGICNKDEAYVLPFYEDGKLRFNRITKQDYKKHYEARDKRSIHKKHNQTIRINGLTSLSHFRLARSHDGINFTIDKTPTLFPQTPYESWGIEDPRITKIGNTYHILYTAVSAQGVAVARISTKDFKAYKRHGVMLPPENKDAVLFPEKIRGKYVVCHRPVPKTIGSLNMWVAHADDLSYWGEHKWMMSPRENHFDSERIGAGAVPIKTDAGWLHIYHGANYAQTYALGAALSDHNYPERIIRRLKAPLLEPKTDYETNGFFSNTIFTCGAIRRTNDVIDVYYGASDDKIAMVSLSLTSLLEVLNDGTAIG